MRSILKSLSGALLPTPAQTDFLRTCLHGDLEAWARWCAVMDDPMATLGGDTTGMKRLVPLLYTALRDANAELEPTFVSYLRAAYVREDLRARTFQRVCHDALDTLVKNEIPFIVLKGVSLAEMAYPAWALRHCHDIDLLLHLHDMGRAQHMLKDFSLWAKNAQTITLIHPTNLPIALHRRLFAWYPDPADVWTTLERAYVTDVPVQVLAPPHHLLHICVHAASSRSRRTLQWVTDSWMLLEKYPALDWTLFVRAARSNRSSRAASVMISYLKHEMNARIPDGVIELLAPHRLSSHIRAFASSR